MLETMSPKCCSKVFPSSVALQIKRRTDFMKMMRVLSNIQKKISKNWKTTAIVCAFIGYTDRTATKNLLKIGPQPSICIAQNVVTVSIKFFNRKHVQICARFGKEQYHKEK